MLKINIFTIFSIFLCLIGYVSQKEKSINFKNNTIYYVLFFALISRTFIAYITPGFSYDMNTYGAWAERMYSLGPSNFYSTEVLTDYPPLYMYVLYLVGFIRNVFSLHWLSNIHVLLLKLPSIISDITIGYLIYKTSKKSLSEFKSVLFSSIYLFLPVVIINSSIWGQIDSIYTLIVVLICVSLKEKKMYLSYLFYGIGVILKPQTVIFTPVLMVGIIDHVFINGFDKKLFFKNLFMGLLVIFGMVIVSLPFGINNIITQFSNTLVSYPYVSANAYNFWALIGMNWADQSSMFLMFSAKTWGSISIVLIVVFTFILSYKFNNKPYKYFILSAFIILTMFIFSVRMHERYLYPFFALFIFVLIEKSNKYLWLVYGGIAALNYYNTAHVLYFYDPSTYDFNNPIILFVSLGMVIFYMLFINELFYLNKESKEVIGENIIDKYIKPLKPTVSIKQSPITRIDILIIVLISIFYSCFALYDLGDIKSASSGLDLIQGDSIVLEFEKEPSSITYFIAPNNDQNFSLEISDNNQDYNYAQEVIFNNVFTWQDFYLTESGKYLKFNLVSDRASIIELSFKDSEGNVLTPLNINDYKALFDEPDLVPEVSTFRNSMYFDEIYHGRTAYEFINGLQVYEYTHPPLGKVFISFGIMVFGMNPFGWRIVGTLFGVGMLLFMYLFSKRISNSTLLASLGTFIFAFDFMHFVQTRIATIDVYVVFFIIMMFYFMYEYSSKSFYDTKLKVLLIPLGLAGISMGLGVASKWTGVYAGIGLGVLFFMNLFKRYREYLYAKNDPKGVSNNISHKVIINSFIPITKKLIIFCIVFFVFIPIIIYTLSYIPYVDVYRTGFIDKVIANQVNMFNYHSDLNATHYFSSSWSNWPIMSKPIWYYSRVVSDTLREGISSFGNPLVWWVGIPALIHNVYIFIKGKVSIDEKYNSMYLIIGYLSGLLPWVFVTRITFIYHYYPSVVFVVLMIVNSFYHLSKYVSSKKFVTIVSVYAVLVFVLFIMFYPVLSGRAIELSYVVKYLRWLPEWILVAG